MEYTYYEEVVQETIKQLQTLRSYYHMCGQNEIAFSLDIAITAVKKLPTVKSHWKGK